MNNETSSLERQVAPARAHALAVLGAACRDGHFQARQRLVECDLLQLTKSSRTTLRETLRQLEADGLVEILPGKGPIAVGVSVEDARQIYTVREALEVLAAEEFVKHASAAELEDLGFALARFEAANKARDVDRLLETKRQIYRVLFAGAHNSHLQSMMATLHDRMWMLKRLSLAAPGRPAESIGEMRALISALLARDVKAAKKAAKVHIQNAARVALAQLKEQST